MPEGCIPDCVCPSGMVQYNGECISEEACPCIHGGNVIQIGQTVPGVGVCEEWRVSRLILVLRSKFTRKILSTSFQQLRREYREFVNILCVLYKVR